VRLCRVLTGVAILVTAGAIATLAFARRGTCNGAGYRLRNAIGSVRYHRSGRAELLDWAPATCSLLPGDHWSR